MTTPLLSAEFITKSYRLGGREIPVLRGVDFELERGEMVALLGASGAGKSTLLHVLGLLDQPTSGNVRYEDQDACGLSGPERARLRHRMLGFVFQFYHLIPELTALQNVKLGTMMDQGLFKWFGERKKHSHATHALLERVGLGDRKGHRPDELSGGERQRVAIARALVANPRIILADEPTGNLDSATSSSVLDLLFDINRDSGIAFLVVTHSEELAKRCDRVVRMRDGVVEPDTAGLGRA